MVSSHKLSLGFVSNSVHFHMYLIENCMFRIQNRTQSNCKPFISRAKFVSKSAPPSSSSSSPSPPPDDQSTVAASNAPDATDAVHKRASPIEIKCTKLWKRFEWFVMHERIAIDQSGATGLWCKLSIASIKLWSQCSHTNRFSIGWNAISYRRIHSKCPVKFRFASVGACTANAHRSANTAKSQRIRHLLYGWVGKRFKWPEW